MSEEAGEYHDQPPQQPHEQFDFISGKFEADQGMDLAAGARAAQEWAADADAAFDAMPVGLRFTGDDLRREAGVVAVGPNKNNAVGAWFSAKSKEHRIRFTGMWQKSKVVSCHARDQKVWEKLR